MNQTIQIEQAVKDFIGAGDTNDIQLLDRVLHKDYQNVQDGFFDNQGLYQFSKEEYKRLVEEKTFGGLPRTMEINTIEEYGSHLAVVNVTLESEALLFNSVIVVVKKSSDWQILNNFPKIVGKG
ncbi:nuclear transport factor 2 family protein [Flagellimonas amoyensis]|uniref:nuclear transport factor 2 family protein n=1 Tax=Flagellimonas amoyensis TaxID=2169401 RepID=UPI000D3499BA|nr:nuclear transport factor 2 family protein [Allomuricauda amoyensis]